MVVPVGHKRMYFHAGCEPPIRHEPDLSEDKIRSAGTAPYPSDSKLRIASSVHEVLDLWWIKACVRFATPNFR